MSTKFITRTLAIWIGNILHQENWNQIRAQPEVATVKTPKNTLSFYFGMTSSAAIFDLNLRPLIIQTAPISDAPLTMSKDLVMIRVPLRG